ncbi:hypothetical protein B0O80DRAFT_253977 [Mortierella sp. GBAus27b]|nr:hypothetical protein B0O80DRAFT_253977 [Mortierella sp. GBAus27b]
MVTPFVHKLKSWISAQKRNTKRNKGQNAHGGHQHTQTTENQSLHPNHPHSHGGIPIISPTEAQRDSDALRSMLGIGQILTPSQEMSFVQQYSSPTNELSPTTNDGRNNSDSLKALLGIQSPTGHNMMLRDGMSTGSPTIHPASSLFSASRPVSTPSSSTPSSVTPYQNDSDFLKAMLGIPTQAGSPLQHFHGATNGGSPAISNAGAITNGHGYGPQRPDFSPQTHFSSANSSPVVARNGPVDLLALLKGSGGAGNAAVMNGGVVGLEIGDGGSIGNNGNGDSNHLTNRDAHTMNNHGNMDQSNGTTGSGRPAMQNFAFDMDALI